ncbi:MAG TPA: hypothetical protein VGW38_04110 [Chloroflexota bacterium]|nr:hypothetical protein [Chloroflexota bacterium]
MERWDTADTADTLDAEAQQRQRQLAYIDGLLAQWEAWRRKQTTVRPPLTREYLEAWRTQLLAEAEDERSAA